MDIETFITLVSEALLEIRAINEGSGDADLDRWLASLDETVRERAEERDAAAT